MAQKFEKNPEKWSTPECIKIGLRIRMDEVQVSKWNWDERKKRNLDTSRRNGQLNKSSVPDYVYEKNKRKRKQQQK